MILYPLGKKALATSKDLRKSNITVFMKTYIDVENGINCNYCKKKVLISTYFNNEREKILQCT
jgi:hypothetical protein